MKTLALFLALCPVIALAQFENPAMVGAMTAPVSGGGGSCNTESQSSMRGFGYGTSPLFGTSWNNRNYNAIAFYASNTVSICAVSLVDFYGGAPTDAYFYVSIYSNSSTNTPGTMLGGESTQTLFTSLTDSAVTNLYALSSPASLTAGTTNWIVFRCVNPGGNDYMYTRNSTTGVQLNIQWGMNGTDWTASTTPADAWMILWKQ